MKALDRFRRAWPHLRAILILLHMAALLTLCAPARHKVLAKKGWDSPAANASFARWADRLSSLGIETSPAGLKKFLRARTEDYAAVRDALGAPAQIYADLFYISQGWSLFSSPKREPAILIVEIHEDGQWRTIYRQRSDEHTWRRAMFDNNRMRKLVGRFSRTRSSLGLYNPLGQFLARLAAEDFPRADQLRTQLWRYKTVAPGVPFDPSVGELGDARTIALESVR